MKRSWVMTRLGVALSLVWSCSASHDAETSTSATGGDRASAGSAGAHAASGSAGVAGATSAAGGSNGGSPSSGASSSASSSGTSNRGGVAGSGGTSSQEPLGGAAGEAPSSRHWQPRAGLTWQWQLSESVSTPLDVDVYDIDWESDAAVVASLHARGIRVVCYVSVGSWEDFRPDAGDFPASVIGNDYDGWPGEKYVDLRSSALRQILARRFDICREKGFDAVEPDNMDVFELGADSGFPLTDDDGVEFALWLAEQVHSRGMGIGQKNAAGITRRIEPSYDWALTESCFSDGDWCGEVSTYVEADKPVFMCEYEPDTFSAACAAWAPKRYSPILKSLELGSELTRCP